VSDKPTGTAGTQAGTEDAARNRAATYVGVVAVEAFVIIGLWLFGRYFSA
jgi:hypothetical protein